MGRRSTRLVEDSRSLIYRNVLMTKFDSTWARGVAHWGLRFTGDPCRLTNAKTHHWTGGQATPAGIPADYPYLRLFALISLSKCYPFSSSSFSSS